MRLYYVMIIQNVLLDLKLLILSQIHKIWNFEISGFGILGKFSKDFKCDLQDF